MHIVIHDILHPPPGFTKELFVTSRNTTTYLSVKVIISNLIKTKKND